MNPMFSSKAPLDYDMEDDDDDMYADDELLSMMPEPTRASFSGMRSSLIQYHQNPSMNQPSNPHSTTTTTTTAITTAAPNTTATPNTTTAATGGAPASLMRRMPIVTTSNMSVPPQYSTASSIDSMNTNNAMTNQEDDHRHNESNMSQMSYSQDHPSFHQEAHNLGQHEAEDDNREQSIIPPGELSEEVEVNTSAIFSDEASHDVESLTEKLNDVTNYLRKEIMAQYFDVKGKLHKKIQDQLRKVISEKEDIIAEREDRIDKLIEGVKKRDFYLSKFKGLTFRMADLMAHVRRQEHLKTLRIECFMKWREYVQNKKRMATLTVMARKHYTRGVKRRILQGWYIWILQHKQSSSDAIWQLRLDSSIAEIKNDYEIKMEQMRQQIEVLNSRLLHETKDKRVLQENLKKALMRGVCAMNNQFLDIIKGTTENPIPNLSEAEIEETMLRQLFENDQSNYSNQTVQNNMTEDELMMPRETIPAATTAHIHQYVKEYQPPSQPYFPTQQPLPPSQPQPRQQPQQQQQYSPSNNLMDASELRASQQKVRVMRNTPIRTATNSVVVDTPPRPSTAPSRQSPSTIAGGSGVTLVRNISGSGGSSGSTATRRAIGPGSQHSTTPTKVVDPNSNKWRRF